MDLRDQLTVYEQFGWINMRAITFSFVDQSSSRDLEKFQWRIQLWALLAAAPPHWPKLRAGHGGATQTRGKFSRKSLTFGHFLYKNVQKAFSFRSPLTPHQGLCPWTRLGAPPPDPRLGSRSARSQCSAAPLRNPGSATEKLGRIFPLSPKL